MCQIGAQRRLTASGLLRASDSYIFCAEATRCFPPSAARLRVCTAIMSVTASLWNAWGTASEKLQGVCSYHQVQHTSLRLESRNGRIS